MQTTEYVDYGVWIAGPQRKTDISELSNQRVQSCPQNADKRDTPLRRGRVLRVHESQRHDDHGRYVCAKVVTARSDRRGMSCRLTQKVKRHTT